MLLWEYARVKHSTQLAASPQETLSAEELARLTQLQVRFHGHPECVELTLDEPRLSFVRWLVENVRISDEM